jgi:hypothetical protein
MWAFYEQVLRDTIVCNLNIIVWFETTGASENRGECTLRAVIFHICALARFRALVNANTKVIITTTTTTTSSNLNLNLKSIIMAEATRKSIDTHPYV